MWTPLTRVSPVWAVAGYLLDERADLAADQDLMLLGPVQPALVETEVVAAASPGRIEIWLTLGSLNVLVRAPGATREAGDAVDEVEAFARSRELSFERWRIADGRPIPVSSGARAQGVSAETLRDLAAVARLAGQPAIGPTLQEFVAISASTLTRAASLSPMLHGELVQTISSCIELIGRHQSGEINTLDLYARLVTMNAALSRFASQAFSGLPPVESTECHFWVHSLLGTGAANIAIARFAGWVQSILGEARLNERVTAYAQLRDGVPTREELMRGGGGLGADLVDDAPIGNQADPVFPLVTYFSGRDGFSSHLQTLSAPLATLAECNSYRSSLMTVTHEISHVFIQGVLGTLYPEATSPGDLELARRLLTPGAAAGDLLDAARQLMLEGIYGLEQAVRDQAIPVTALSGMIPTLLKTWRADAQETLVHTFDFLYFYQRNPTHYIESIWYTWSAIPGISDRVPEYVMRTLCAISVAFLEDPPDRRLPSAVNAFRTVLAGMVGKPALMSPYVPEALAYLDGIEANDHKGRAVRQEYSARLCFVRLAKIFLYSEKLAARLFSDPYAPPRAREKRGRPLIYDTAPIGNPLSFLRDHLKADPSEAESAWVLHCLAFSVSDPTGAGGPHGPA